jgi:hypothetical protein
VDSRIGRDFLRQATRVQRAEQEPFGKLKRIVIA